jgi:hypothetical protein
VGPYFAPQTLDNCNLAKGSRKLSPSVTECTKEKLEPKYSNFTSRKVENCIWFTCVQIGRRFPLINTTPSKNAYIRNVYTNSLGSYRKLSISNLLKTVSNCVFNDCIYQKTKIALLEILIISKGHAT